MSAREKSLTKGTRYVAEQAITDLYDEYVAWADLTGDPRAMSFGQWAVTRVWDVEYKPTAGRLIVVLDLNEAAEPAMQFDTVPDQCPNISNGHRCGRDSGHSGVHDYDD